MNRTASFFLLPFQGLAALIVGALILGGLEGVIAQNTQVERRFALCLGDRIVLGTNAPRLALNCAGSERQFYSYSPGLIVTRSRSSKPIRLRCTTYRFTDTVDDCQ